jgi:hypothetical protein
VVYDLLFVRNNENMILDYFPLLCVLLTFINCIAINYNGYGVVVFVEKLLHKIDASIMVVNVFLNTFHVRDYFDFGMHPRHHSTKLFHPLLRHIDARQLNYIQIVFGEYFNQLQIISRNIVNPEHQISILVIR